MFIAGLAIVLSHNRWTRDWRVLNTLVGWGMLTLGLVRLFTATRYIAAAKEPSSWFFVSLELCLILVGLILSYFGYHRAR